MRGIIEGQRNHGRLWRALVLAVVAVASGCSESTDVGDAGAAPITGAGEPEQARGDPADGALEFLDGRRMTLEELRGRHLFVNYWAEWCAPCLEEIPELNELHEDPDAFVIGINYDRLEPDVMRPQVEALGIHFPVAVDDPAERLDVSTPEVLPSTFVFGPDGIGVTVLRGPQTLAKLRAAMGAAPEDAASADTAAGAAGH